MPNMERLDFKISGKLSEDGEILATELEIDYANGLIKQD